MRIKVHTPRISTLRSALATAALGMLLGGCGLGLTEPGQDDFMSTTGRTTTAFEAWRTENVVPTDEGRFMVEGDLRLPDLATVRRYWEDSIENPNALAVSRASGADSTWNRQERWNVSYCIRPSDFGADYDRLVDFMQRAASGWEAVANVRFVHVKAEDASTCNRNNARVKYNVERNATPNFLSGMGFPTFARPDRFLELGAVSTWTDAFLLAVLTHEFGHALGFRHEHETAKGCGLVTTDKYRQVTCYDGRGAMHYPHEGGWLDPNRKLNFISEWDVEGAQSVYEAPTNVLSTADGTVFARRRSTGDIYRRNASGWIKIGNPGQAFVAVGNTLYGQIPGRGAPVKYLGNGWVTIGGPVGQIFECVNTLCATDPTSGKVSRYSDTTGTWTTIGEPGSRFAATTTKLFSIGPWQDDYVKSWSGSGIAWSTVGSGASELIGGGTSMYRLNNLKDAIQRYDGGSTWVSFGGPGRSFVAAGGDFYGLRPDGSFIMKYAGTHWNSIHGPATKIFGSNGFLFTTNADDTIERYEPATGSWTKLGKP